MEAAGRLSRPELEGGALRVPTWPGLGGERSQVRLRPVGPPLEHGLERRCCGHLVRGDHGALPATTRPRLPWAGALGRAGLGPSTHQASSPPSPAA